MFETRVNLKHLLEDLRDGYGLPIEEIILTELIANSLDSKASRIEIFLLPEKNQFIIQDNGQGMRREKIKEYHDIAATTKMRGKGIGFAGVGAKLSLLVAKSVVTETKGGYGSRCATQWYLSKDNRAPWKFIPFSGSLPYSRGTRVQIEFFKSDFPLLSFDFIFQAIKKHYYPLLDFQFNQSVLKQIYKRGVEFFINGQKLNLEKNSHCDFQKNFKIIFGKREKKLAGFGYLARSKEDLQNFSGIAISTFGKVIKWGWDWLGLFPKSPFKIWGLVEVPALAEILTTNKNDFLKDSASLKKYYKFRKAIQEAILPILEEMGEGKLSFEGDEKRLKPLEKEIETTLRYLLNHFPELTPLVGIRKRKIDENFLLNNEPAIKIVPATNNSLKEKILKEKKEEVFSGKKEEKKKTPTLTIGFEKNNLPDLARMVESAILINTEHPAYQKAKKENSEEYHLLLSVAWALSQYLEEGHSPQKFISQFLASWAFKDKKNLQLFQTS